MATPSANSSTTTVLFLTDPHLDRTAGDKVACLLRRIRNTESDVVIATGDISDALNLRRHLGLLAEACYPRPLYFLLGNHDYYGGDFDGVASDVQSLCGAIGNLHHLDGSDVIQLSDKIGLLGHGGWADARAGDGMETTVQSRDGGSIKNFVGLNHSQMLDRMRSMGVTSAQRIRRIFPLALTRYHHVIVATHVPPFYNAVLHHNNPADRKHLPHFCNLSMGVMLFGIMRYFPHRDATVLAGHSHGSCARRITRNLSIRVGASRVGDSIPIELLRFAA
jgi:predicted phosphohydrolase